MARYDILWGLINKICSRAAVPDRDSGESLENQGDPEHRPGREDLRDALVRDFYLRENCQNAAGLCQGSASLQDRIREFYRREEKERRYLPAYGAYDARQMERMTHLEVWGDGSMTLFDYRDRDPLDGNARCIPMCAQEVEDD